MTADDFQIILKRRLKLTENVLGYKAKEYSNDEDRFHNFNVAARWDAESPERALWGMLKKHLVSVQDIVNTIESGTGDAISEISRERIDEKIGDCINYLILLEGIMLENLDLMDIEI